jgi:hypothetical protein
VPLAPDTNRSRTPSDGTTTDPAEVQLEPLETEQLIAVLAIVPGVPLRSVTVIVFDCREKTESFVAVQPVGTHVRIESDSVALALLLLTE